MSRGPGKEETVDIQKELSREGGKVGKYMSLFPGKRSLAYLVKYEFIIGLCGRLPGAFGLLLRSKLYPKLMGRVGRNVSFGVNVTLRHPHKIFIGDNVVVDDHCVLDAKGQDNKGIEIGDGVFIGRNTLLFCKNGDIILGDEVNVGFNSQIFSASRVFVGAKTLLAAYSYLVGGTHNFADPLTPVLDQGRISRGIEIGPGGWIGAHATVMDGIRVGRHAVIGAGSVVSRNVPKYAVMGGNPLEMINRRKPDEPAPDLKTVTIGLVCYNGIEYIQQALDAIQALDYGAVREVIVIDNGSTDGSGDLVREKYPDVTVIDMENNGPNPARNRILEAAKSQRVLLMDSDIVLAEDAVSRLSDALDRHPGAGAAGAQIRSLENRDEIQYNGADIHFAGGAVANPFSLEFPVKVGVVPGGAMLVDRQRALEVGAFDEDFFFGYEDGDFTYRLSLAGYPCYSVSKALAYHPSAQKGIRWVRYQVRNRWWFMLKNYSAWSLFVLMPAILIYHLAALAFFAMKGKLGPCLHGGFEVFTSLPSVLKKRRQVMKLKKVSDRKLLTARGMDMLGAAGASLPVRVMTKGMNVFYKVYWAVLGWMIR